MNREQIFKEIDTLNRVVKVNYTDVENPTPTMMENTNIAAKLMNELLNTLM